MVYGLSTTDLADFKWIPGRQPNSNIALLGHLDYPARINKAFHDWPGELGIEPYVAAGEIMLGGRDISLFGYILADSDAECRAYLRSLYNLLDSFNDLVPLTTPYGVFNVYINAAITAEYISDQGLKVTLKFREPMPDLTGIFPVKDNGAFGIDTISFKSLGGFLVEIGGDVRNRPAPKAQQFTSYYSEGYQVTKRQARELTLRLFIEQPDYASFKGKVASLYALFTAPGLRTLTLAEDVARSFFVKDGFQVTTMFDLGTFAGVVECKLTETGSPTKLEALTIKGSQVTINNSTVLIRVKI